MDIANQSDNNLINWTLPETGQKQTSNGVQPLYAQVIIVLMYILIIIIAVGGNVLFSYIILTRPKMRSVTNLFLLNLAISDVMKAVICNPFAFMANLILLHWPYGDFMCPLVTYVQVVAVFLSAFTLVAMSVDRYLAILNPMRPKLSKRAFTITMSIIWVLAFAAPLPTAITSRVTFKDDESGGLCLEVFEDEHNKYIYSVLIMMFQYFIPLAVITITNSHIGYIVWIKKTPGEAEKDRDRRMAASKRRLVKMILIVVVIYAVCWLPLHVITLVGDNNPEIYSMPHMNVVWLCAHWLAMSHSCYNPIVYFWLNSTFRANLGRVFALCRHKQKQRFRHQSSARSDIWNRDVDIYDNDDSEQTKYSMHTSIKSVQQGSQCRQDQQGSQYKHDKQESQYKHDKQGCQYKSDKQGSQYRNDTRGSQYINDKREIPNTAGTM